MTTLPFINLQRSSQSSALILSFLLMLLPLMGLAQGGAAEVTIMLPGDVPLVMVKIPAGTFQMGSPEGESGQDGGHPAAVAGSHGDTNAHGVWRSHRR